MDRKTLAPDVSVSAQITVGDLAALQAEGVKAIICNRPDGEGADQPRFSEIEAAAQAAGIDARYVPVVAGQISDDDVAAFGAALAELPRPVLAYCRSGARSSTLWSLWDASERPKPQILAATK